MKKKNLIAKDLRSLKYRSRIVKPKKGKGSFKRKKNKLLDVNINVKAYYNSIII